MLGAGRNKSPQQRSVQSAPVIPPIQGIDVRLSIAEGDSSYCLYTYNLVPYEYGVRIRKGFREWQTDVTDTGSLGVQTIIPFDGVNAESVGDKLFAVTNEGIWDVTLAGDLPVLMQAFSDTAPTAGYGPYAHYVGNDGDDVLFYADSLNGLFRYDPGTDTWAQAPDITGPDVTNIRFIVLHKQRLWLIEENSTDAWYLPVGSISGAATKFTFGSKFRHGGNLVGLYNWSVDGGNGLDDFLVAVSRAGDVLPYQGADPSSAETWNLRGTYFIGAVPRGPFIGSEHGGDLFLLSAFGLTAMSDLLQGVDSTLADGNNTTVSARISGLLRDRIGATLNDYGWGADVIPSEGAMIITSPRINNGPHIQYVYNLSTKAWAFWRDVPARSTASWRGSVVFGTADNRVCYMDTTVDELKLIAPVMGVNGDPIKFSLLTSFQGMGNKPAYKRINNIRTDFIGGAKPTIATKIRYDYDLNEIGPAPTYNAQGGTIWDVGIWDQAIWGSENGDHFENLAGNWGMGRVAAIALRGETRDTITLAGWDVLYSIGSELR